MTKLQTLLLVLFPSLLATVFAQDTNDYCYTLSWNPDSSGTYQNVHKLIRPVRHFSPEHSLVQNYQCVNGGDVIPHNGIAANYQAPGAQNQCTVTYDSAGTAFYSYDNPVEESSNSGLAQSDMSLMYFIVDDAGFTSLVITNDIPNDGSGGELSMGITSVGLAGNTNVAVTLKDDPSDFGDWDNTSGSMTGANWKWASCCTDGGVMSGLPPKDWCMTFTFDKADGIDAFRFGSMDDLTKVMTYKTILKDVGMLGMEVCAHECVPMCSAINSETPCAEREGCGWCGSSCETDTDGDGIGDSCDTCPYDPKNDEDNDGLCGDIDLCPLVPSAPENFASACADDLDGDGVPNPADNCPNKYNPDQGDSDGDGIGNACDNCADTPNSDQLDIDRDGIGDECSSLDLIVAAQDDPQISPGVMGDPHFKPFKAKPFSFHGQCDLVVVESKEFASGLGLQIHIRTTRVKNRSMSYSFIEGVAVQLGANILEVQNDGSIIMDGNRNLLSDSTGGSSSFAGYLITKTLKGKKKHIAVYDLDLGKGMSVEIRANSRSGFLYIDFDGTPSFPTDTVGLLGSPFHYKLLNRDGTKDLSSSPNTHGEEWQVKSDDPKLFQDKNRLPQYPHGCTYEDQQGTNTSAHLRRRRLMDDAAVEVSVEAAEAACAHASGIMKQFCIDDVIAAGDIELAEDRSYGGFIES